MSQGTVIVLGAGASAHAGAPLMADFLDRARFVYDSRQTGSEQAAFEAVFRAISRLQLAHSKATLDLTNVESVFAAFEMARLFGRLGDLAQEEVEALPEAMSRVITRTLDASVFLRLNPIQGNHPGPQSYQVVPAAGYFCLARIVHKLLFAGHDVTLISFNYDTLVEHSLGAWRIGFEYGLPLDEPFGQHPRVQLLKLHGSINWAVCDVCPAVVPHRIEDTLVDRLNELRANPIRVARDRLLLDCGAALSRITHCNKPCRSQPLVVPPTWNKSSHYGEIQPVWRRAAERMAEAENIVVIGYSWPASDHFFHHLYALGTAGVAMLRRFLLVDPSVDVAKRYATLLGQQALARFDHIQLPFESASDSIAHRFGLDVTALKQTKPPS